MMASRGTKIEAGNADSSAGGVRGKVWGVGGARGGGGCSHGCATASRGTEGAGSGSDALDTDMTNRGSSLRGMGRRAHATAETHRGTAAAGVTRSIGDACTIETVSAGGCREDGGAVRVPVGVALVLLCMVPPVWWQRGGDSGFDEGGEGVRERRGEGGGGYGRSGESCALPHAPGRPPRRSPRRLLSRRPAVAGWPRRVTGRGGIRPYQADR